MARRLPPDLMDRSAEEASRLLALSYLDQIDRAQKRLADPLDLEALHDFRVGLRRLRSCLRAYRAQLKDSLSGKSLKRLRALMTDTNAARDAEVQLLWLRKQAEGLGPEEAQGVFWLIGRLEGRQLETLNPSTAEIGRRFGKTASKLRRRLATLQIEIATDPRKRPPTFGEVAGELVQQHVVRVRADLKRAGEAPSDQDAHRARISVKRLRYLIEPLVRNVSQNRTLVRQLKEVQDALGRLHDLHVLAEEIASSLSALAGDQNRLTGADPGLRALERLASEQAAAALAKFQVLCGRDRMSRALLRADELGNSLKGAQPEAAAEVVKLNPTVGRPTEYTPSLVRHAEHVV
jgi:CHAD domain-containing protein